ncbi:16S rRNA (uracil(1498)-N(3))-methyltransferase [Christensenellaceae bacterium OttesenSCG-928-L17]|nr:16S rRNA (uracil(1498)-N(3))-methyltransferase [Christensenellaceae bacterium OttesenSCG-928-L17]
MERFFVQPAQIQENEAWITGDDVAHITRVLRCRVNDMLVLVDGAGMEYTARIVEISKQSVRLALVEQRACEGETACRVTLYQALPKAGKMETIVQKCVELGVFAIQPVQSERCVVRPDDFEKKRVRYQRVAHEAAKQSRRGIVPELLPLQPLAECAFSAYDTALIAYEEESERMLKDALRGGKFQNIALIVGPEGGFTQEEVANVARRGAVPVSLGKRILRTETAGMAMLAMTLYELES